MGDSLREEIERDLENSRRQNTTDDSSLRREIEEDIRRQKKDSPAGADLIREAIEEDIKRSLGGESRAPIRSKDLKTLEGLEKTVEKTGLDTSAIPPRGEDPNKIYSGGFVMDVFDTLNLLSYGSVGLLQGKGVVEGVKTRASFSDKDSFGKSGAQGAVLGVMLDIAFDPLTYIAPVSIFRKLGITSVAKKVGKTIANIPIPEAVRKTQFGQKVNLQDTIGDQLGVMFVYRYGQDPVYQTLAERAILNKNKNIQLGVELTRPMAQLDTATQQAIGAARKAGDLSTLPPEVLVKAKPAFDKLDDLSRQAVDLGLLDAATVKETIGSYMARLYRVYEDPASTLGAKTEKEFRQSKVLSAASDRFKKRTDIPEEVREAMGEILEAGYPTAKAIMQLTRAVENAKFFKQTRAIFSRNFETAAEATAAGFAKLPDTDRLASLSGAYVPKFIADDLNEMVRTAGAFEELSKPIVGAFKYMKVILNPATHARNVMSNLILNGFEGMPPGHPAYIRAAKEVATKGKWYKEAEQFGLGINTFAAQEIGDFLQTGRMQKLGAPIQNALKKIADLYQKEEEFAKMAQYIFQRTSKGLSPEEAWKVAERATFNYAQVTPFIRHMRTAIYGMPFITFTYKATPQVVRTALNNPQRIAAISKVKEAVENQADQQELEEERATEPEWMRSGFYVKLPMKDREGRSAYLDLTYILPFGDLVGGNLFNREIDRETGFRESIPKTVTNQSFALNVIDELVSNQDFYGNQIFKESDPEEQKLLDIARYLFQTMAPPLAADLVPGGYREDGERRPTPFERVKQVEEGDIESGGAQTRTALQEFLARAGIKINPVDQDIQSSFAERGQIEALRTLLRENGIMGSFDVDYVRDEEND